MKLPVFLLQKGKNYIHGLQGLVIFLAWALTIAVFTKTGKTDGRTKYYFTLVSMLTSKSRSRLMKPSAGFVYPHSSTKPQYRPLNEPRNS